jgi:hypothetical protein
MGCQRVLANGFRVGVNLDVIEALGSDRFNCCDVTYSHAIQVCVFIGQV